MVYARELTGWLTVTVCYAKLEPLLYFIIHRGFFKTSVFEKATLDLEGKPPILAVFRELFEKLTEF